MFLVQDITTQIFNFTNKFTSQTGIKVNVISGKDKSLQKRIIEEGEKFQS